MTWCPEIFNAKFINIFQDAVEAVNKVSLTNLAEDKLTSYIQLISTNLIYLENDTPLSSGTKTTYSN